MPLVNSLCFGRMPPRGEPVAGQLAGALSAEDGNAKACHPWVSLSWPLAKAFRGLQPESFFGRRVWQQTNHARSQLPIYSFIEVAVVPDR
jgi:hypothetical protein